MTIEQQKFWARNNQQCDRCLLPIWISTALMLFALWLLKHGFEPLDLIAVGLSFFCAGLAMKPMGEVLFDWNMKE